MGGGRSCSNGSCCFVPGDFVEWERAGNNLITTYEFGGEFGSRDSVSWMVVARHNSNSNTTTTVSCLLLLKIVDFKFYEIMYQPKNALSFDVFVRSENCTCSIDNFFQMKMKLLT